MNKSRLLAALAQSKIANENLDEVAVGGEEAGEAAAVEVTEAPLVEEPELIEQATEEVMDAETEVEADTEVVEQLDEAAAALESIYDALRADGEEGLSPQAARYATLAVESITTRLGLDEPVMASLESFEGQSRRVDATSLSMEQIGKKISEIWAAIWKWLMQVKESILNFLRTYFTKMGRVKARAEKLEAAAKAAKGKAKSPTVDVTEMAKRVAVGTKLPAAVGGALDPVLKVLQDSATYSKKQIEEAKALRTGVIEMAASGNTEDLPSGISGLAKAAAFVAPASFKHKSDGKQGSGYYTDLLPGNVVFFVGHRQSIIGKITFNASVSGKENRPVEFDGKWTVKTDLAGVRQLVAKVKEVLKAAEGASKTIEAEIAKTKSEFKAVKIGSEADDKVSAEDQVKLRMALRAYKNSEAEVGKAVTRVSAYAVNLCNDYLTVAQKVLAQYGGGAVAADKGKAAE